jgi:hypothetical protein
LSSLLFLFSALLVVYPLPAYAARYYEAQTDFDESSVPVADYVWDREGLQACVFKEQGIPNSYYVWAKLTVQGWRQALREYRRQLCVGCARALCEERSDAGVRHQDLHI